MLDCPQVLRGLNFGLDDIMRARIKTLGVSEHRFALASNNVLGRDWLVYDVGGHRSCVSTLSLPSHFQSIYTCLTLDFVVHSEVCGPAWQSELTRY